jgi:hypothetical protein
MHSASRRAPSVLHSLATEHTDALYIVSIKISVDNLKSLLLVFRSHRTFQEITRKWPPIAGFTSSNDSQDSPFNARVVGFDDV